MDEECYSFKRAIPLNDFAEQFVSLLKSCIPTEPRKECATAIQVEPSSLLFQHIAIIRPRKVPLLLLEITYEEKTLRYVAGFVCSKVQKKITASK